jgi:hypothetical protein
LHVIHCRIASHLDQVARKAAVSAVHDERERRMALDRMREVAHDLRRVCGARAADAAAAKEQAERMANGPVVEVEPTAAAAKHEILNEIERLGSTMKAREHATDARAEAEHERVMHALCEELVRSMARKNARAAVDEERARRVFEAKWMHEIAAEVRSATSRRIAAAAACEEQRARVESGVARTYWTVDQSVIADAKAEVNSDVERIGNRSRALEAMEAERDAQTHAHVMRVVCEQLERSVAQKTALNAAEDERAARVAEQRMHAVAEELRRAYNAKVAAAAAREEQRARVESGVARTYWVVDPTVVADTKHDVNSDVERKGNRTRALEAMEEERQVRIHADRMAEVTFAVRRLVAQRMADQIAEIELAQAKTRHSFDVVADEVRRTVNRRIAQRECEREQRNRIEHPVEPPIEFDACWRQVAREMEAEEWVSVTPTAIHC